MIEIKSVRIKFDEFLHDTGKAILISIDRKEFWIPKKLCRNIIVNKKLAGHISIPSFFYKKMGFEVTEDIADVVYKHHIPTKIKKEVKHDANLTR